MVTLIFSVNDKANMQEALHYVQSIQARRQPDTIPVSM